MGVFSIGTETYLYISGLKVTQEVRLNQNQMLLPIQKQLPVDKASQLLKNDVDFAIAILNSKYISSQLKIVADDSKSLAALAWNAQWDLLLLSAIFNCESIANIQSTDSLDKITNNSYMQIINYHLHGIHQAPYVITQENSEWLSRYFDNAQSLLRHDSFSTAVHSMATYRWHSMPRVQLTILWAGIEALFNISNELVFRISLYIANFLSDNDKIEAKRIFHEIKRLYKARSSAVHGDDIKGDAVNFVEESARFLNKLLIKCIIGNMLPNTDELIF